jgi:deoxyribodipyrimidine photo-lyase
MPPKRKAASQIPTNAASAAAYTDAVGNAPNKRSRIARPSAPSGSPTKVQSTLAFAKKGVPAAVKEDETEGDLGLITALETSNSARGGKTKKEPEGDVGVGLNLGSAVQELQFDHSRPEERAGIVDRRFYPQEMNHERCAMYNNNEILRPIEVLNGTLVETKLARGMIRDGMEKGDAVVHWFKRDLRVKDNTGLNLASQLASKRGVGVIGVWIMSPQDWEAHLVSPPKCDFELRSVKVLQKELADLDIPLHIEVVERRRDVPRRLVELVKSWGAKCATCNLEYEPDELRREERLVKMMLDEGINFEPQHDDCVVPPGSLKTGAGKQYAVYSPWFRAWLAHLHAHPELLNERPTPKKNPPSFREQFARLFDIPVPEAPENKRMDEEKQDRMTKLWPAGEMAALERLSLFLDEKVGKYQATRNFPALKSTARVSVHHAAGTLAARTSVRAARDVNSTKRLDGGNEGIKGWISEVAWRDFYRHVLVHWPYVWYVLMSQDPEMNEC